MRIRIVRSFTGNIRYHTWHIHWLAGLQWQIFKERAKNFIMRRIALPLGHWIGRHVGAPAAAFALLHLNRAAGRMGKYNPSREEIYARKNVLVRYWYERGLCERVTKQQQVLQCWYCKDGIDEWHDGDSCDHCDGTGAYASHTLFKFTFHIGGRYYSWHQPERLITWPIIGTVEQGSEYKEERGGKRIIRGRVPLSFFFAVTGEYMRVNGLLKAVPTGPESAAE
jgi:hypothetical protein